jgi:5,10-methylenetetrahydrofolate reductase
MTIPEIMKNRMTFSFEVFPPKIDQPIEPLFETLGHLYKFRPDFVTCTYGAGGTNVGRNLEIVKAVNDSGKTISLTHFTCIGNTKDSIKEQLQAYLDSGITHILAMRGDLPAGWEGTGGDFKYANELVEFIKTSFPQFTIAVAGYPEKHVQAPNYTEDIAHLKIKVDAGGDFLMTQLCHDVDKYSRWVDMIRKANINLPIVVGVMPVLNKDATIRMAVSNGSSIPSDLAEVIGRWGNNPDDFRKAGIDYTINQIYRYIDAGINGLHIYALNKWKDVSELLNKSGIRTVAE